MPSYPYIGFCNLTEVEYKGCLGYAIPAASYINLPYVGALKALAAVTLPSPHPHLQIRQCRPDVPLGALGNLTGDGDGDAPPPREECRENLVFRGL